MTAADQAPNRGTPEEVEKEAARRAVAVHRRWEAARKAWAADNGYTDHEMYAAAEAARLPAVDHRR